MADTPVYRFTMRDKTGNRMDYAELPHHAHLHCKQADGKTVGPIPLDSIPRNDLTRTAFNLLEDKAAEQAKIGASKAITLSPIDSELGQLSPLAILCREATNRSR